MLFIILRRYGFTVTLAATIEQALEEIPETQHQPLASGQLAKRLALPFTGMTGGFSAFSPDGHMLAVSRADSNSTMLYSIPESHELKSLAGDGTGRLAFSRDGLWSLKASIFGISAARANSQAKRLRQFSHYASLERNCERNGDRNNTRSKGHLATKGQIQ
jgi:hypothetical protein